MIGFSLLEQGVGCSSHSRDLGTESMLNLIYGTEGLPEEVSYFGQVDKLLVSFSACLFSPVDIKDS